MTTGSWSWLPTAARTRSKKSSEPVKRRVAVPWMKSGKISRRMRYTVIWKPPAEERLAEIWLDSADRNAVTAASDAIDIALREDPVRAGESRPDGARILIYPPLAVYFDAIEEDRTVFVWWVFRWEKKP